MAARSRTGGTILCVDDDVEPLKLRKAMLEMHGYSVLTATNAEEALKLFDAAGVDAVLTDHLLSGQSGIMLAAEMRRRKPHVAVAIYSGVAQVPEDMGKADVFITKLVTPEELIAYLDAMIRTKSIKNKML
jgi:DNA-binding response OmpR family regulator